MKTKKVFLTSSACYIVQTKTNQIAAYLKANGYELVRAPEDAEAHILTTCAVTGHAADATNRSIEDILQRRKDGAPLYVVGCYTRIETSKMEELLQKEGIVSVPEVPELEEYFPGDQSLQFVIYNDFFDHPFAEHRLGDYARNTPRKAKVAARAFGITDAIFGTDSQLRYLFRQAHLYSPYVQRRTWPVVVAKGCMYKCSYCAVRIGTGKYVSKPLDMVIKELKTGVQRGHRKVLLVADELGTYGLDRKDGTTLSSLLEVLLSDEYPVKVGMWYLDAFRLKHTMPVLSKLVEMDKVFFAGITVQHGSPRILKLMNRHYSVENTIKAIGELRRHPSMIIATQFMVGFPTETEGDFERTLEIVETGYFDLVEVYPFSARPGTEAAEMVDDVPPEVKAERAARLEEAAGRTGRKRLMKSFVYDIRRSFTKGAAVS